MTPVKTFNPNVPENGCGAVEMPFTDQRKTIEGNLFNKYEASNPIARWLVENFVANVRQALDVAQPKSIVDVGCADGKLASLLIRGPLTASYLGLDISSAQVALARASHPQLIFAEGSAYCLPTSDACVDLALALEVLEHLDRPGDAVTELARVSRRWALVSVPWEPIWRMLNVVRGAYVAQLGNTPGHLQHFSRRAIRQLVQREFRIVQEYRPLPWTMLLLEKR